MGNANTAPPAPIAPDTPALTQGAGRTDGHGHSIHGQCIRVLLIESNQDHARKLRQALTQTRSTPFSLTHVERLSQALDHLSRHPVDVVLLDLTLPDAPGPQSLQRVRKQAADVPILALANQADDELALLALTEGAQDCLVKSEARNGMLVRAIHYAMERKRSEDLLRRQQVELAHLARLTVVGQMSSSLAHELNQPLAAILNYATAVQNLLGTGLAELDLLKDGLAEVANESRRAIEIIRRTRALVRKEPPKKVPADLRQLIGESVKLLAPELRRGRVCLRVQVPDALPPIMADTIQIGQVLTNLMRNAIEAMAVSLANRRDLLVTACQDSGALRISVTDSGCGAPVGQEAKLFDPFFTTKPDGLGMGLPISRSIVESHGGQLTAANNPDFGMTFHFTLPLAAEEAPHEQ